MTDCQCIAPCLYDLQAKVDGLKLLQADTAAELDAPKLNGRRRGFRILTRSTDN